MSEHKATCCHLTRLTCGVNTGSDVCREAVHRHGRRPGAAAALMFASGWSNVVQFVGL